MIRFVLLMIFSGLPLQLYAQLHVEPNVYIYVSDRLIFVNQPVSLAINGNIYLRDEAQFIQPTVGLSANAGMGKISLYQEGTSDSYDYNYWCSPVGNAALAPGNDTFGITLLERPVSNIVSTPAIMLSNTALDGTANPLAIAPRWIYKFLSSSAYSQWLQVLSASSIAPGEGFTMKGTGGTDATSINGVPNNPGSAQRYDFRGKPNDGDIAVNVANNQFTLMGNPYPSAIDLSAFLTDALNCTGIAYFWEQDRTINSHLIAAYQGGYGTFSPISRGGTGIYVPAVFSSYNVDGSQLATVGVGSAYPRRFSPIGQGFMVRGNGAGPTVTMTNLYRIYQKENPVLSVFERSLTQTNSQLFLPPIMSVSGFDYTTVSTAAVPQIRINALLNDVGLRQTVLAFDPTATDGVDHGMDAMSPDTNLPGDAYFPINDQPYVISVVNFDIDKRIPIGMNGTDAANYKIAVAEILNVPAVNNVYIYDKMTSVYTDIKNGYFEVTLPGGTINNRFELTFTNEALQLPDAHLGGIEIVQNNASQLLEIQNPLSIALEEVSLYDISGKRVLHESIMNGGIRESYDTAHLAEGLYIVKLAADGTPMVQKILVHRK